MLVVYDMVALGFLSNGKEEYCVHSSHKTHVDRFLPGAVGRWTQAISKQRGHHASCVLRQGTYNLGEDYRKRARKGYQAQHKLLSSVQPLAIPMRQKKQEKKTLPARVFLVTQR